MRLFAKVLASFCPVKEHRQFKILEQRYKGDDETIKNQKAIWLTCRGNNYGERNKLDKAIADFEKAIKLKDDFLPAYLGLAIAWSRKGEDYKFEKILQSTPEEMKLHGKIIGTKKGMIEAL